MTKAISGLLGGAPAPVQSAKPLELPTVPEVKAMPVADDAAVKRAKAASAVAQMQRSGRASTMLSDASEKLG